MDPLKAAPAFLSQQAASGCAIPLAARRLPAVCIFLFLAASAAFAEDAIWIDAPFVRQVRAGCGSASIAMVMQYWARHEPGLDAAAAAAERVDEALPPSSQGISGKDLQAYLEANGFSAFVFDGALKDLRHHLAKGRPIVVCLGLKGPQAPYHYAVVVGIGGGEVLLNDPARGKLVRETEQAFLRAWKATGSWALLAVPREAS